MVKGVHLRSRDRHAMFAVCMLTGPIHLFLFVALLTLLGLHLFYDRRNSRTIRRGPPKAAHHCIRCDTLYTAPKDEGMHPCPKCATPNPRLKY
jgi:hypothetical protein